MVMVVPVVVVVVVEKKGQPTGSWLSPADRMLLMEKVRGGEMTMADMTAEMEGRRPAGAGLARESLGRIPLHFAFCFTA